MGIISASVSLADANTWKISLADEICDNGIDDDGDGLIDLNDDDCGCNKGIYESVDLIPNPGFELTDGCCSFNLGNVQENCLEDWIIISPSPDLLSPNCLTEERIEELEEIYDIEIESAILRAYYGATGTSEVFGTCFNSPLEVDFNYNLSFRVQSVSSYGEYVNMALYGVKDCDLLANVDSQMPCSDSNVSELSVITNFTPSPSQGWENKTFSFVADYPYEAFFIAFSCSEMTFPGIGAAIYYDDFEIEKSQQPFTLSATEGSLCDGDLVLSSPLIDQYTYQWYIDGVAISGATNNEYAPTLLGEYQLIATTIDGSFCVESLPIIIDESYEFFTVYLEESICYGSSIVFNETEFSEAGVYNITSASTNGCDTLFKLRLETPIVVESLIPIIAVIMEGETYTFGNNILTEEGIYFDTIDIAGECDSLSTLYLSVLPPDEPNLTYSSSYLDEDCSVLSLTVCNTGNVDFTNNILHVTLYDGNPVSNNSANFETIMFDNNSPIEPSECKELTISTMDFSMNTGDIYAFINDMGTSSTPFDFENDFPTTDYPENDYTDNLFVFNIDNCEEVCPHGDLVITQTDLNETCSELQLRVCNIGQTNFEEDNLFFSFYDDDPLTAPANFLGYFNLISAVSILADDCVDISIDLAPYNSGTGEIYGMLNDLGVSSTPFDLENDFPNTSFTECSYLNNNFTIDFEGCPSTDGANLTFDSYLLFDDCSELSISLCNTGNVPYSDTDFYISFYDGNPIATPADNVITYLFFLSESIDPGECYEAKLFSQEILLLEGILYGFINDNQDVSTPFDFENDFPTTNFAEDNYNDNLFFVDFDDCILTPQAEICNNNIDDDGDGLIDAFDPDCHCNNEGEEVITYIQNPGFEEHTGCIGVIDFDENSVDGWAAIQGTTDYYSLDCSDETQIADIEYSLITTFDDSFISFGFSNNFSEMIGSCLLSPLLAGEEYNVDILAALPTDLLTNINNPMEITLYGFSDPCPDFSEIIDPSANNFCQLGIHEQAEEIITISSNDLLNLEFTEYTAQFTPINDIHYVALSIVCDEDNSGTAFFQIAYVQISSVENSTWSFDEEITITNPCNNTATLSVPYSDTLSYQWYLDSIPLIGAVSSSLAVDPSLFDESNDFYVYVFNDNGCVLIGPENFNPITIIPTDFEAWICEGDTFSIDTMDFTIPGNYQVPLLTSDGCDSLVNLDLMFSPFILESEFENICMGQSFLFGGQNLTLSGIYLDTIASLTSCDTIISLNLTVGDSFTEPIQVTICEGATFSFAGDLLSIPGIYYDTLTAQVGCDSIIELTLSIDQAPKTMIPDSICEGTFYEFSGDMISTPGLYYDTLNAINGCDSIIELTLSTIDQSPPTMITESICEGEVFDFNGIDLSTAAIYQDTLSNILGCDSIIVLDLIILDASYISISESICENASYDFNGQLIFTTGIYYDTLANQLGCDSIIELTLAVSDYIRENLMATICEGETYFFDNANLTLTGTYMDTIAGAMNCDTIITLELAVESPSLFSFQDSICVGDFYEFAGEEIYEAGIYIDTLNNDMGCDSIITLTLNERSMIQEYDEEVICDGDELMIGTQTFDESGEYTITLESSEGCDTLLTLLLTVQESLSGDTTFATIAAGETYNFNGIEFDEEGFFDMTISSIAGCDSIVFLDLSISGGVHVPNVFSPSSTTGNERLIIFSKEDILITKYNIFDRWGNMIFTNKNFNITNGENNFWDGNLNYKPVARGVYVYHIEYTDFDGKLEVMVGTVTVL